jgi:hypothetical protein
MEAEESGVGKSMVLKSPSLLLVLFSAVFAFWFLDFWKPYNTAKNHHNFNADVMNYYSYLPATFCNGGSFDFHFGADSLYLPFGPKGTFVPKCTYGMAAMYAPFFALGYKVALNQQDNPDGFSEPFATCVRWGSIFYVLCGMLFLRAFLLRYFNELITTLVLSAVLFGSMLFNYTFVQSELTHGYLFALFCAFLWLTAKWHEKPTYLRSFFIALVMGLVSLIRPTEVYIFLFFLLWEVKSMADVKVKWHLFTGKFAHFILMGVVMLLMWVPQALYWKAHAGSYYYYPYMEERFFWSDPQLFNILFSYRKGWITYTPIVLLAFAGLFVRRWDLPLSRGSVLFVTLLTLYILSCWWDWSFGGCFGARAFCQHIAFLSIPMAVFMRFVLYGMRQKLVRGASGVVFFIFLFSAICLNIGQTYQSVHNLIHPWATSKELYWYVFRRYQFGNDFQDQYWSKLKFIEHEKWMKGEGRGDD